MKYLSFKTIKVALHRILTDENVMEHRTSTVGNSLLTNYFPLEKYTVTPEVTLPYSGKRLDFLVERLDINDKLVYHAFAEMKCIKSSTITNILDQAYDSIMPYAESLGENFSVYLIAIKGVNIAFFQFFNCIPLLDEYSIRHYKGFIPLNLLTSAHDYMSLHNISNITDYFKSIRTDYRVFYKLRDIGVGTFDKMPHPCI
jgi:hypothetical protein